MTTNISPAITALSAYATGTTVELSRSGLPSIAGASLVDCSRGDANGLESIESGTVDAIIAVDLFDIVPDRVKVLYQVRQALSDGGVFAFTAGSGLPPTAINSLFKVVGGFGLEITAEGEGSMIVARRSVLLDVRQPFGVQSAFFAAAAETDVSVRSELYFQVGTLLLRSGDPKLAEQCYRSVIDLEPRSSEGYLGLGMCFGSQGLWSDALTVLQQALALDPNNAEAAQWVQLARESGVELEELAVEIPAEEPVVVRTTAQLKSTRTQAKLSAITDEVSAMSATLAKLAHLTR